MKFELKNSVTFENHLHQIGSYWQYLTPDFEEHLSQYLTVFEKHRKDIQIIPSENDWKSLPFGSQDNSWKWRRESLAIINKEIKNKTFETVLEIGAWNGWLTKYLAKQSQTIIAVDYFTCACDGISNINSFAKNIEAIQCNLETVSKDFKPKTFDLIVVNHCLSYVNNPVGYIKNLIPLLKAEGKIISLGNTFYSNPAHKIKQNNASATDFQNQYGMPLYIAPVKGYMDWNDREELKKSGFKIQDYPQKKLQNVYAKINPSKPVYVSIIYK